MSKFSAVVRDKFDRKRAEVISKTPEYKDLLARVTALEISSTSGEDFRNHVDGLEDEFRHAVHELESQVEYLPNEDAITDKVSDEIHSFFTYGNGQEAISSAIQSELENGDIGSKLDTLDSIVSALNSIGSELQYLG